MRRSESSSQLKFLDITPPVEQIVNVACVPQRSPFRYPGGKTWLIPRIRQWLSSLEWKPSVFLEPFAGGAIVGLTVAFEKLAEKVVLVELDEQVSAVWMTILNDDCEWLVERILSFDMTIENLQKELAHKVTSVKVIAFQTILKNRTFHGGIMAPGSGLIKHGENGKGIKSRWYPETIAHRIRAIADIRDRIEFIHSDGIHVIASFNSLRQTAMFIDPPYTAAGKRAGTRLYKYFELNHNRLFEEASKVQGDVLLTYDNAPELAELAFRYGFETRTIYMKNTHHAKMSELLIGRNLNWLE
ncbi:MAG: DNA adenine methylase [Sedimentisphaerales bacterium]|nr:DNA adenine methylase [Sedimentisphaerales bacterium]